MPGSTTTQDRTDARLNAPDRVAFHLVNSVGILDLLLSRLNGWPAHTPVNAS